MKLIVSALIALALLGSAAIAPAGSAQAANCTQVSYFGQRAFIYDSGGAFYSSSIGLSVGTKWGTPVQTWNFYVGEAGVFNPTPFYSISARSGISGSLSNYHVTPDTQVKVEGPGCSYVYNVPDPVIGTVVFENRLVYGPF